MARKRKSFSLNEKRAISIDEFEQWIVSDDSTPVSEPVTDEDIILEVQERFGAGTSAARSEEEGEEEEEEDEEEETVVPSTAEMRNAVCILKTGLLHVGFKNFDLLHRFKKEVNLVLDNTLIQRSMDKFVK